MYKIILQPQRETPLTVLRLLDDTVIPFDPANTDYQQFKLDITNGAELQDPDGNVMSSEQVTEFLSTLP